MFLWLQQRLHFTAPSCDWDYQNLRMNVDKVPAVYKDWVVNATSLVWSKGTHSLDTSSGRRRDRVRKEKVPHANFVLIVQGLDSRAVMNCARLHAGFTSSTRWVRSCISCSLCPSGRQQNHCKDFYRRRISYSTKFTERLKCLTGSLRSHGHDSTRYFREY